MPRAIATAHHASARRSPSHADATSVRAYVAGVGYHRLFVDGKRVGTSELDAGWSTTEKRLLYSVFDLGSLMTPGSQHAVGVELGNGWWNPLPLRMWGHLNVRKALLGRTNGTREPMLRAVIVARMPNGSSQLVAATRAHDRASGGWRTSASPTVFNNIYLGEKFDARAAEATRGWATVGHDVAAWAPAVLADASGIGALEAMPIPPIRRQEALITKQVAPAVNGTLLLDVGRNIAGGCEFNVSGHVGSVVRMRYGELLDEHGQLNVMTSVAGQIKSKNKDAPCQPPLAYQGDSLVLSGRSDGDRWGTAYAWHGFRFLEVSLPEGAKLLADVVCHPMRTDVDRVANFSSASPALDQLRTLNRRTFDANMMSVQSDCPHRERFGYGGDALGCGEAGLSIYDWEAFYSKRVVDFNDAQRLLKGSKAVLGGFTETAPFVGIADGGVGPPGSGPIGWQAYQPEAQLWLYKYYGDLNTLHSSFNSTLAFVRMLDAAAPGAVEHGLGDWMPIGSTSTAFTGLGFQRMAYLAFANISSLVGAPALAHEFTAKARALAVELNKRFLDTASGVYHAATTKGGRNDTQCGQGLALFSKLCPDTVTCGRALRVLADNARTATAFLPHACQGSAAIPGCADAKGGPGAHLTAGLFGIKWALMALADGGLNDLAYEMLTQTSFPSYGWMMSNAFANATTLWESWFFSDNVFSHDHPMFASSEVWLLQSVAGIQPHPAAKGMSHVLIKPSPPSQLEWCEAAFSTPRGRAAVSWRRDGADLHLNVSVPPNVLATIHVPGKGGYYERGGLDLSGARGWRAPLRWTSAAASTSLCQSGEILRVCGRGQPSTRRPSPSHGSTPSSMRAANPLRSLLIRSSLTAGEAASTAHSFRSMPPDRVHSWLRKAHPHFLGSARSSRARRTPECPAGAACAWTLAPSVPRGSRLTRRTLGSRSSGCASLVSEYSYPWQGKTMQPVRYSKHASEGRSGMATYRLEPNKELYEGVRYAWLLFEPPRGATVAPWTISGLRIVCKVKPVNYTASYASSDTLIERVWYQGAYAVRLNMEASEFNSILMERGDRVAIQGDGHPTMAAALTAFGREAMPLVKRMLNATDSGCQGCHVVDDSIMAYPVYWTMSVNDYFWASGDAATFRKFVPDVRTILDKAATKFWPMRPNIVWMGWDDRLGNGWCGTCNEEAQLAFATLLVRAHRDFGRCLKHVGMPQLATQYAAIAANLTSVLRAGGGGSSSYGLHAAANAINAEVATAAEAQSLFARLFNDTTSLCSWSPFNQYWILQAIGNVPGLLDYALASVRLCWGTQLFMTTGCFLELWDPQWKDVLPFGYKTPTRPSYCHPWSSGVTHWLTERHLGVTPLTPGFHDVLIAPHVSAANPSVSGTLETPQGSRLHVNASRTADGLVRVELETASSTAVVALPTRGRCELIGFRRACSACEVQLPLRFDHVMAAVGMDSSAGRLHRDVTASLRYAPPLPPGRHVIEGIYEGCANTASQQAAAASYPPFGPAVWKATATFDRITRGSWIGTYGNAGYVLFGFNNGSDVVKLPKWCVNVTANKHGFPSVQPLRRTFHGSSAHNASFLQAPPRGEMRALGSVGDDCSDGCQGSVIDVNVTGRVGKPFTVGVYMVAVAPQKDGPGHASQQAIRAMDLQSLSPIAKLPLVSEFEGGVYWRLVYDRGVRLRLMPVFGGATVSAVIFDE